MKSALWLRRNMTFMDANPEFHDATFHQKNGSKNGKHGRIVQHLFRSIHLLLLNEKYPSSLGIIHVTDMPSSISKIINCGW